MTNVNFDKNELTGFVEFPSFDDPKVKISDTGRTMIYLCAFENTNQNKKLSNLNLKLKGVYCGDDLNVMNSALSNSSQSIAKNMISLDIINGVGHTNDGIWESLISSILIGWSKYTYESLSGYTPWVSTFRSLTEKGQDLYYGMKKLHNESEIKLITFNQIK